ncbi:hypothetical protein PDJAM_G00118960 [Pangasius djambal]|uniref:Uncharacterized protein n=1 Tax=Pangasius djambal TaxID=1691987 RepID=A0ACC5ZA57_9TELE|nr:hypothetical protein [Pangasius djambal]
MLWAMFCWETLGPGIHVDVALTRATRLNIAADQVHPFMAAVFTNGSGLFQQDNAPCHTAKNVQERFEEHDKEFKVDVDVDVEVLKKRAERFGMNVSSVSKKVEEDEKLKKRKERFGIVTNAASVGADDSEAKKRKRAERFGNV